MNRAGAVFLADVESLRYIPSGRYISHRSPLLAPDE